MSIIGKIIDVAAKNPVAAVAAGVGIGVIHLASRCTSVSYRNGDTEFSATFGNDNDRSDDSKFSVTLGDGYARSRKTTAPINELYSPNELKALKRLEEEKLRPSRIVLLSDKYMRNR